MQVAPHPAEQEDQVPEEETDRMIDRCTRKMCDRRRQVKLEQRERAAVMRETGSTIGASRNKMKSVDLTKKRVVFL